MFNVGKPVYGEEFIDRKKELKLLKHYIREGQNTIIKAPRRYGKSSLIKESFRQVKKPSIYLDIKKYPDIKMFSYSLIEKSYELVKIKNFFRKIKESVVGFLEHIEKEVEIPVYEDIKVTLKYLEKEKSDVELLEHALSIPEKIGKHLNKDVIIALDEFQDIVEISDMGYDILNVIRAILQHQEKTTYIFAGSQESLMTKIFQDKNSPFFHFGRIIELEGLEIKDLTEYAIRKFKEKGLTIPKRSLMEVMSLLKGQPYYCMKVLQNLYYNSLEYSKKKLTKKDIDNALNDALMETKTYIEDIISKVKAKKHHYEVLYAVANNIEPDIDEKNLYRIHKSLEEMGYLKHRSRGVYEITDAFLEIYLKNIN